MTAPNPKNFRPQSWLDLALFLAVAAFCAYSLHAYRRKHAPAAEVKSATAARGLASTTAARVVAERSTRVVALGCLDEKSARTQTDASLLQLTANGCGSRAWQATNQTTGEKLMVFERAGRISTHYFPLKPGLNRIVIEWKGTKKNSVSKMIEIEKSI